VTLGSVLWFHAVAGRGLRMLLLGHAQGRLRTGSVLGVSCTLLFRKVGLTGAKRMRSMGFCLACTQITHDSDRLLSMRGT